MGFYFNDPKRDPKPRARSRSGHIPIASMNQLGCSVCPRDKDKDLLTPKMPPSGTDSPLLYLMGTGPNEEEDSNGIHWSGNAGRAIISKFDDRFFKRRVRSNHITQCMPAIGGPGHPDIAEIECCRGRVVPDIEESRPLVVVGVGDEPLHWATGLPRNAITFRGTLIATKIGKHTCWYFPILYPNYIRGKQRKAKNEWELTLEHDIAYIEQMIVDGLEPPVVYEAPYDKGIELITGQEQGDIQRLEDRLHALIKLPHVGFDIETGSIKPHMVSDPKIWTAAIGQFDHVVAFPIDHPEGWGTETRMRKVMGMLGEFIKQSGRKRCHQVAFEQEWSAHFFGNNVLRETEWEDTMAMGHTFDSRQGTKSLDIQCRINLGFFLKAQSKVDVSRDGWIKDFTLKEVLRYNALDSKWADKLADVQLPRLRADRRSWAIYERKMRLAPTLVLTTARGLPVDMKYAEDMVIDLEAKVEKIEERIRRTPEVRTYGQRYGTFSPTNSDHVLKLMADVLQRPEVKIEDYEGKVSFSTNEEVLEALPPDEVPSAAPILEHRALSKCLSTYLLPIVNGKLTAVDGEMHAEYNAMSAVTGRLTSDAHNWPKHKFKEVRGCITAYDDEWLVAADYGQIEFRVAGMLSEDDNIIKYSWTGYDVHGYWAKRVYDEYPKIVDWIVSEFEVDWDEKGLKTLRQVAKNNWVFPQLFGATTRSCAGRMHIPVDIADDLGAEFWDEFKGAKRWQERTIASYHKNLYVETLGGFRRRGPMTVNELINMPIQGTACEIVVEAQSAISERAQAEDNEELQPAFNGHDDLTYRIRNDNLEANIAIIAHEMCKPRFDYINVPLIVEVSVGPRWNQLEEVAKYSSATLFNLRNPYA